VWLVGVSVMNMMPSACCFFSLQLLDFNEQLIRLVQPWPVIFYCRLPNYKNEIVKGNVWRELYNDMMVADVVISRKAYVNKLPMLLD